MYIIPPFLICLWEVLLKRKNWPTPTLIITTIFKKKTGQITYPKPKTRGSLSLKMLKNLEPEGIGNKDK